MALSSISKNMQIIPKYVYNINERKVYIKDSVYKNICIPEEYMKYIFNDHFVAKWDVLQLGGVSTYLHHQGFKNEYYVGNHNRWQHCNGTAHLTLQVVKQLRKYSNISSEDERALYIGALWHDIGHAMLSHIFEHYLITKFNFEWTHDEMSTLIIRQILSADGESEEFINKVCKIIMGDINDNNYLYNIVSNKVNGFDTDCLDYLSRDYIHTSGNIDVMQYHRKVLLENMLLIDNKICFYKKPDVILCLIQYYENRKMMSKKYYQHYGPKCVELMYCDALEMFIKNNYSKYNIQEMCNNVDKFQTLTDKFFKKLFKSKNKAINDLITNAKTNTNMYYCLCIVNNVLVKYEDVFNNNDINKDHIYIMHCKYDFKCKNENPLKFINFSEDGCSITRLDDEFLKTITSITPLESSSYIIIKNNKNIDIIKRAVMNMNYKSIEFL